MKTRESLGIFWSFKNKEGIGIGQEDVDGIIFYGLWKPCINSLKEDGFKNIWNSFDVDVKLTKWGAIENASFSMEVYIKTWDDCSWENTVAKSLRWFVDQGAVLAWCGSEMISPSLTELEPIEQSQIYAAYSEETGLLCNSALDDDFEGLSILDLERCQKIIV